MGDSRVTIESSKECRPHRVILEKPLVEMTRPIKPLYVRAHLNGRPVSKVPIDNGSALNVMSLRMLRALRRSISDMIETEVVMSAFTGEVSKTLGILPMDITIDSKTELSVFFVIKLYYKLQHFVREGLDSCQVVCAILSSSILTVLEK